MTVKTCARCGGPVRADLRTREGLAYHRTCYYEVFRWRRCSGCGATVSARADDGHPLCRRCLAEGQSCGRCGKGLDLVAAITETGFLCPSCASRPKSEVQCESCGEMKGQLAGRDDEGRRLCGRCLRMSKKEGWKCPECHRTDVPYHSKRRCRYCFTNRRARRELKRIAVDLRTEAARKIFSEYAEGEIERLGGRTDLGKRFAKQRTFFTVIDGALAESPTVSLSFLKERFGGDLWTKWRLPTEFLCGKGVVDGYEGPVADGAGEAEPRRCSGCVEPTDRIGIYWGEEAYCYKCRGERFEEIPCGQCGRNVFTLDGEGPAICKYCRAKGQKCAHCHRPLEYVERITPEGYACRVCSKSLEPKVTCPGCGGEKTWVTYRDQTGRRICAVCNKAAKGERRDSRPRGDAHKDHSPESCRVCAEAEKSLGLIAAELQRVEMKDHFVAFGRTLVKRRGPRDAIKVFPVHLTFFDRLGCNLDGNGKITLERLLEAFRAKELFSHRLPVEYLKEQQIIVAGRPEENEKAYLHAWHTRKQRRILEKCKTHWYGELVCGYHQFLTVYVEEGFIKPRTATGYLYHSERFLRELDSQGLASVEEIGEDHYRDIADQNRRVPLRTFLQYLREYVPECEMIYPEEMPYQRATSDLILDDRTRLELLEKFLGPSDDLLRVSLLGLLMLLCFQSPGRVVKLRRNELSLREDGVYAFGEKKIPLGGRFSKVVGRYLATLRPAGREESASEYLFPGPSIAGHIDTHTVHREFRKLGLKAGRFYATAIARYFLRCNTEGIYLTEAYGVPPGTVRWYRDTFLMKGSSAGIDHKAIFGATDSDART